ncbi:prefoldin subunit beta [archaeon]|nr:prefoldin subunit beta [archaeon]|tara:strand:+ start:1283 stop:1618 length:336 start_codon:yes stop_codon:yes gene_type:complete
MAPQEQASQEKIQQLQLIEQNMQTLLMQKQKFQSQLLEIDNASKEVEETEKEVYKIVGTIMVESEKPKLTEELKSQKEVIELRIKNIEKQEGLIKEKESQLQSEIMKDIKK